MNVLPVKSDHKSRMAAVLPTGCGVVRSFTGMDQNGLNYQNGLPEWTLICALEYFLFILLGQSGIELPQKAISPRNM